MRKIAIAALLFICSACFVYGKDAVGVTNVVDTQDAPVENYKPLETDVEDEQLNEEDSIYDDELMDEEEPLEDERNAVDSNDIETDLQGDTEGRRYRRRNRCYYYKRTGCGRTVCRRRTKCKGKRYRRCVYYRICYRVCHFRRYYRRNLICRLKRG